MTIKFKAHMFDGTPIQIEDWSTDYPNTKYQFMIGAYPISKHESGRPFGPRKGEQFRLSLGFETEAEASEEFENLWLNRKTLLDYADKFWNPADREFLED